MGKPWVVEGSSWGGEDCAQQRDSSETYAPHRAD